MDLQRRTFLRTSCVAAAMATFPAASALANISTPYSWDLVPPMTSRDAFVAWMEKNRAEDALALRRRWDRFQVMVANRDLVDDRNKRAFLRTPPEDFVLKGDRGRA